MKLNPYKQIKFFIDKNTGQLKVYIPDKIKDIVHVETDEYQVIITIK